MLEYTEQLRTQTVQFCTTLDQGAVGGGGGGGGGWGEKQKRVKSANLPNTFDYDQYDCSFVYLHYHYRNDEYA